MAGMAKPGASLQVSFGNIFVRRLRNPVDGHFGADCESQCFRGLRGAHHGCFVRRLAERPANLKFFLRALAERRH